MDHPQDPTSVEEGLSSSKLCLSFEITFFTTQQNENDRRKV